MTNPQPYRPTSPIHPGESLLEALEFAGISQKELGIRTDVTEKHISGIINGSSPITPDFAIKLERVLGVTVSFWNNLQKNYDENLAYQKAQQRLQKEVSWLDDFVCYQDLVKWELVAAVKKKEEKVEQLLRFFGVDSLYNLESLNAKFRSYSPDKVNIKSVYSWLRCGDLMSKNTNVKEFNISDLKSNISKFRELTLENNFASKLIDLSAQFGVAVVFTPYFKKSSICGAFRWVGDIPLIQLNTFGGYLDIFWFSFFHELGHAVLHGKKAKYIDISFKNDDPEEIDANNFASNMLIPKSEYDMFIKEKIFNDVSVANFSNRIGVNKAIVQGRLAHDKHLDWSHISDRPKLAFANPS